MRDALILQVARRDEGSSFVRLGSACLSHEGEKLGMLSVPLDHETHDGWLEADEGAVGCLMLFRRRHASAQPAVALRCVVGVEAHPFAAPDPEVSSHLPVAIERAAAVVQKIGDRPETGLGAIRRIDSDAQIRGH